MIWRTSADTYFEYKGIRLKIRKGVFHPGFFESTKVLLNFVSGLDLKEKTFLELGAGSGLISFFAAQKGAKVTASDINPEAIEGLLENARNLGLTAGQNIEITQSDLFGSLKPRDYDYIVINPPFYRGQPVTMAQHAWYAGPELQYFTRLFCDINRFVGKGSTVLMVFADIPELEIIKKISERANYSLEYLGRKESLFQDQVLFKLQPFKNSGMVSNASC